MGRTTSSSKPKSSIKKKSKLSSQTRRKKTSKRKKSKRVHSDDSVSSHSDESLRSVSVSLSDSEDGNVSRKGRSRVRDKVKSSKKRVRRSCSSDDSSVDVKVRKRSKRSGESKVRKKTHKKKKKSRRKVSVSSSSSDSGIVRTRRHDSPSDTEESEHERKRGRSKKRKKDKTSSSRIRDKKRKLRSRSCSSCSRYSDDAGDLIKDKVVSEIDQNRVVVTSEILPRRLKSVITVVQPHYEEEVTGQDKDENKEEIFYDQDDYPSCRSNDSNDGVRRDLARKSYIESEERAEYMVSEEDLVSELVVKESKLSSTDRIDQSGRASLKRTGNKIEIDTSTTTAGSGSEDLETILRQKALENLMRFRGPHRNAKPPSHHENKSERNVKSLTAKADDVQNRSSKQELSSGVGETGGTNQHSRQTMRTNSSRFVQTEEMKLDGRDIEIESSTANQRVVHPSDGVDISGKSESNTSPLMEQPRGSSLEQVPPSPLSAHVQGKSSAPMNVIHKSEAEKSETVAGSIGDNQNVGIIDARVAPESSSVKPISEEHNSKPRDESKGNSFEQKTMSVMRGGEMVQVSYKVYIPNKAPALARRKLQR